MRPPAATTRLIVARHGETEYNRSLRCQGWLDAPLNDTGRAQARRLAERLGDDPVACVLASPLKRAEQTASEVAKRHGLDVETHEGLKEINHGKLEGVPFLELDEHVPGIRDDWRNRPETVHMPEGECLADVQERVWPVFEEVTREHVLRMRDGGPYGRMVIVSHAVAIATVLCKLRGEPLSMMPEYRLGPCGFFEMEHTHGAWKVVDTVGLMGHTRI